MLRSALLLTLVAVVLGACGTSAGMPAVSQPPETPPSAVPAAEVFPTPVPDSTLPSRSPLVPTPAPAVANSTPVVVPAPQPATNVPSVAPIRSPSAGDAPPISAAAAAVLDHDSGTLLYQKDASRQLAPASLTKIASAAVALEEGDLDAVVSVDVDSGRMPSSSVMGLLPNDTFSLSDLVYGMMLPSGNDAALAVGRHIAGSDAAFVDKMNALAGRLQLTDTRFVNPHGLSSTGHLSSARDLGMLARYAMDIPKFREIVATPTRSALGSRLIELKNVNPFLHAYPGADGVKTGYTRRSGRTMLASATRAGHRVYVILLNAPEMEKDAAALMDWAFQSFHWRP